MPNLVGIGLSQVPTNSMLGGLAYQSPDHASIKDLDLKNLSQINSEIADTAVDIFIYDTSKDSDGGAWRKRTTHTSWYNETLNTATRGSRREFPSVAVIVAEATQLTIYDGDDPDLPMWMVFNLSGVIGSSSNMLPRGGSGSESDITSVAFLNAKLVVGLKDVDGTVGEGPVEINFISDFSRIYREVGSGYTGAIYDLPISGRNSSGTYRGDYNSLGIIQQTVNDVAMTVLPNAPIDSATGLPVPTIAVATDGGVSVIKDDGTVVDLYRSGGNAEFSHQVAFDENNSLFFSWGTTNAQERHLAYYETIPSSDDTELTDNYYPSANFGATAFGSSGQGIIANNGRDFAGSDDKQYLTRLYHTKESATSNTSSVANITSSYNTGWMHGNIKGAFLSDTTVESLTANTNLASNFVQGGTNRLTSETYDDGDTSWQMVDDAGSANGYVSIELRGLTIGQSYIISMTLDNNATLDAGYNHRIAHLNGLAGENATNFTHWNKTNASSETLTGVFVAQSVNDDDLVFYANAITLNVSNFIVRAVDDEDRSVKNKGLQVFGTITKSAVATGAELVAYSGFPGNGATKTNYLEQPYNADLNLSTTFCFVGWIKVNASTGVDQHFFDLTNSSGANRLNIYYNHGGGSFYFNTGGASTGSNSVSFGQWYHLVVTGDSTGTKIYSNGVLKGSTSGAYSKTMNSDNVLTLGTRFEPYSGTAYGLDGSMALIRVSASVPSAEQVKKMYEDEKVLFQENAKCTLYGSSDTVTALAYDKATDLLHVGTSSGRSDFQGLRRINNTTTAVTTAISAHDEFIVEQ